MRIQPDYSDSQTSSPDSFYAHPDYPMDAVSAINLQFSTVERFASPEEGLRKIALEELLPCYTFVSIKVRHKRSTGSGCRNMAYGEEKGRGKDYHSRDGNLQRDDIRHEG